MVLPKSRKRTSKGVRPTNPGQANPSRPRPARRGQGRGVAASQGIATALTDLTDGVAEEHAAGASDRTEAALSEEVEAGLTSLGGATTDEARQAAAIELATQYRAQMVDTERLQAYLGRTDVSDDAKTATLGQLAVEKARAELLLGTAHEGGNARWESPEDKGPFPDHYQDTVLTHGRAEGAHWCTSFAGTMQSELGFQFSEDTSDANARSPFWSGYRFEHWAETGQANNGTQLNPADEALATGTAGSVHVAGSEFATLTRALGSADTDEARAAALATWLETHSAPQAGDIIVLDGGNAVHGSSHTVMVERFDAATGVLTTVEGNANDRVSSRALDLTNQTDVATLASLGRLGASMFEGYQPATAPATAPGAQATRPQPSPLVSGESLVAQARRMVERLFAVVEHAGWVEHGTASDSADQWLHGGAAAGEISTQ
jgi:hypothetical protein